MFKESLPSPDAGIELAQSIAQTNPFESEPIGQINALEGDVFITRTDGAKVQATDGAPIFQGEMVETDGGGAIGITFADQSSFSLAENGAMVIDEMVYDPSTQSGTSAINVAEGVFTFVSGQIAKTDVEAMTITTPVAVIGIRGTSGGGKAGAEGTANTFSLFQDASGTTGEMVITTLGGAQTLGVPNQTTQITSAYVPPTKPVTLPAAAVAKFYAKAAKVAPTKIVTDPVKDSSPTQDGPTDALAQEGKTDTPQDGPSEQTAGENTGDGPEDGPVDGPPEGISGEDGSLAAGPDAPIPGEPGAPQSGGPVPEENLPGGTEGGPDGAFQDAEIAAANAFDQILAQGGSLEQAIAAGMNAATEAGLNAVLAANPEHFGTRESGLSVMDRIAEEAFLGVTGRIDPLSAGTGGGTGADSFSERMFFQNAVDSVIQIEITGLEGLLFGDFVDGPLFGGEGEFFEQFFDDPFEEFVGDVFFDPYLEFTRDHFLFEGPPPPKFDGNGVLTLTGDQDNNGPPPVTVFYDFQNGTIGDDTLFGNEGNTRFTMVQGSTLGGTDILYGGPGTDEMAFEDLSDMQIVFNASTFVATYADSGSINGQITLNSVEQLWVDNGTEARVRLVFDGGGGSGFGYILSGTSGADTLTVANSTSLNNNSMGHTVTSGQVVGSIVFGSAGDDTITGSEAGDIIYGGSGNDTIYLTGTAGGNDGDTVFAGAGNDIIKVATPSDILNGSSNPNVFVNGGLGTDTLQLEAAGSYTLASGPSALTSLKNIEILDLLAASTTVSGSGANFFDNLSSITATATSTLSTSDGSMDLTNVTVSANITTLTGVDQGSGVNITDANDSVGRTLSGTNNADTLSGQGGGDVFFGGDGNDTLNLGASDGAADVVQYTAISHFGTAGDTINQFEAGSGSDTIDFASALLSNGTSSTTLAAFTNTNDTVGVNDIFVALGGANFTSSTAGMAVGAAAVISALDTSNLVGTDKIVFAMDDGTDTHLWYFQENGTTTNDAETTELIKIATISGLSDAAAFNDADFTAVA